MKKILFALLSTFPFLFAGCGEEITTTGGGDITPPPTEKNLTVSGIENYYFIPIADTKDGRKYHIQFNINNNTTNNYNNVKITPIFTDEKNHTLTETDGLTYTAYLDNKDIVINSSIPAHIYVTYTGTQKINLKFQVEVASDNMPKETFDFKTAYFLTYLQAFLYTNSGTSESLIPITTETTVPANTTETTKIIFLNLVNSPLRVLLKEENSNSGEVILPKNPLTLKSGTTYQPCTDKSSTGLPINAGTFLIGQHKTCYLEIKSNLSDKWIYNSVKSLGSVVVPTGYKSTDAINIQVQ